MTSMPAASYKVEYKADYPELVIMLCDAEKAWLGTFEHIYMYGHFCTFSHMIT